MSDTRHLTDETMGKMIETMHAKLNASLKQEAATAPDLINHPPHYTSGGIETIDVIEAWGLGFALGNCVKYISRAGKKDPAKALEDLKKARWYLDREIKNLEAKK